VSVRIATITIKSPEPDHLASFWRELLGYVAVDHPTTSIRLDDPSGAGPTLLIQPAESVDGDGPMHFDLRPTDQANAVARAMELGATRLDIGQDGSEPWEVLADPDGNPFCVLQTEAGIDASSTKHRGTLPNPAIVATTDDLP
jgi:hypothetical protein